MHPNPDDEPHLFVVEHVDLDDDDDPYVCYLLCPFDEVRFTYYEERKKPRQVDDYDLELRKCVKRTELAATRSMSMHTGFHYCTLPVPREHQPPPVMTFYSRWRDPTIPVTGATEPIKVCARIEINPRYSANYGCYYQEVVAQNGLLDAVIGWRNAGQFLNPNDGRRKLPPGLPPEPGAYPIYYWSEGSGEGFEDGFMFKPPWYDETAGYRSIRDVIAVQTWTSPA